MIRLKQNPLRIFLADDDVDDRELFGEAIKETIPDTSILTFSNGNALIEHLKNTRSVDPDIIFLDINMPLKNGKECLFEIRKDNRFQSTPIIMFSTSLDMRDIADTYHGGANLFISKPDSFRTQVEVFKQVFNLYSNNLLVAHTVTDFVFANAAHHNSAGRLGM